MDLLRKRKIDCYGIDSSNGNSTFKKSKYEKSQEGNNKIDIYFQKGNERYPLAKFGEENCEEIFSGNSDSYLTKVLENSEAKLRKREYKSKTNKKTVSKDLVSSNNNQELKSAENVRHKTENSDVYPLKISVESSAKTNKQVSTFKTSEIKFANDLESNDPEIKSNAAGSGLCGKRTSTEQAEMNDEKFNQLLTKKDLNHGKVENKVTRRKGNSMNSKRNLNSTKTIAQTKKEMKLRQVKIILDRSIVDNYLMKKQESSKNVSSIKKTAINKKDQHRMTKVNYLTSANKLKYIKEQVKLREFTVVLDRNIVRDYLTEKANSNKSLSSTEVAKINNKGQRQMTILSYFTAKIKNNSLDSNNRNITLEDIKIKKDLITDQKIERPLTFLNNDFYDEKTHPLDASNLVKSTKYEYAPKIRVKKIENLIRELELQGGSVV